MLITSKSLEDWNTLQLDKWKSLEPNINTNTDSMVSMDAAVISEVAYTLQQDLITQTNNAFLAYAIWDELTNLWADRGIPRKFASKSIWVATFSRSALATINYTIPAWTMISTLEDIYWAILTFVTTTDWVLYWQIVTPTWLANTTSSIWTIWNGTYIYKVTAIDWNWNETDTSATHSVVISNWLTNNSIELSWNPVASAFSYNIYLGWFLLANSDTTSYTDIVGTTASIVIPPVTNETWATSINVAIESSSTWVINNVGTGAITKMIEPPLWIEEVNNSTITSWWADDELDSIYRARIVQQLWNNFWKVTISWYKGTAEAIDWVASATVLHEAWNPSNEISVFITATWSNPIPNAWLITEVQNELNLDENRAVCDSIIVYAPTVVTVNITLEVIAYDTISYTETTLTDLIKDTLQSFLLWLGTWATVKVIDISNAIYGIDAITDFTLSAPTTNTVLTATQIASSWVVTITF